MKRYLDVDRQEVPPAVIEGRWDVPARNQGQIVSIAYLASGRGEAGPGAAWRRIYDGSDGSICYQRRAK